MVIRTFKSFVRLSYLGDVMITGSGTKRRILELLASSERGLSWRELKSELKVSDPVLAKHLKRLLEEGLITEEIDKEDRRIKIYKISDKGLFLLKKDILTAYFFMLICERFAYYSAAPLMKYHYKDENIKNIDKQELEKEKKAIIDGFGLFIRDLIIEGLARKDDTFLALLKALELFKKYIGYEFKNKNYIKEEFTIIKQIECVPPDQLLKETLTKISENASYSIMDMLGARKNPKFVHQYIKALENIGPFLREIIGKTRREFWFVW